MMSLRSCSLGCISLLAALAACGGDESTAGTGGEGGSSPACALMDDPASPGQYADTCVKREWAEPYVGTYASASCQLTITTPAGGPPAVFELVLTDAAIGGTYTHDWEGGTGQGNDSYYRFTTDASFATTKALNFGVGQKVSDNEERSIRFRIDGLDTATPSFTGGFGVTVATPFSHTEADCGVLVAGP